MPCGTSATFQAAVKVLTSDSGAVGTFSSPQTLAAPACPPPPYPDRHSCPTGDGAAANVARPINVGSGDVSLTLPLFTLQQEPLPLSVAVTYHSGQPAYPSLTPAVLGTGWTHSFAQAIRPIPSTNELLHFTPEGDEHVYTQSGSQWNASLPAELRGTVTVVGSEYRLTDLDGLVTAFDITTGRWLSTTDRWGNALVGTYRVSTLTVTDSAGREVVLTFSSGLSTTIDLPGGGQWRFSYNGSPARLEGIFDPLHTGSQAWRGFAYSADS